MKNDSKNLPHDTKHNTGNLGATPSRMRPNVGTKPQDKQDNANKQK